MGPVSTAIVEFFLPNPWPVPAEAGLTMPVPSCEDLHIVFKVDGSVEFQLAGYESASTGRLDLSRPLSASEVVPLLSIVTFRESGSAARLNGKEVSSGSVSMLTVPPVSAEISIGHPDATLLCAKAVSRRGVLYASHMTPVSGRVALTPSEELLQLREAALQLELGAAAASSGNLVWLPAMRALLRTLIVEKIDTRGALNKNYVPLLFRVAARYSAPLPVFSSPAVDLDAFPPGFRHLHFSLHVSLERRFAGQVLVDLRSILDEVGLVLDGTSEPPAGYTQQDLLKKAAETLGAAHYDANIPAHIAYLQLTDLTRMTVDLARVTAALARSLVHDYMPA